MEAFVLSIRLFAGAPILTFPVEDCEVGREWFVAAMQWADRSGIPRAEGPLFMCGEREGYYVVRAHR